MNFDIVKEFLEILESENIVYGLGGSSMLYFHQLVLEPRDLDLVVKADGFVRICEIFEKIGTVIFEEDSGGYKTENFATIIYKEMEVDIMSGFKVVHEEGIFEFIFNPKELHKADLAGMTVYLTKLEDWLVAYSVFHDPKNRVPLIKEALIRKGKWDKNRLRQYMDGNIPKRVKDSIVELL